MHRDHTPITPKNPERIIQITLLTNRVVLNTMVFSSNTFMWEVTMAHSSLIQVRVDDDIKRKADSLFSDLGLDTPTAIRIFLNHSIRREGMPFAVERPQPNAETLVAMLEKMDRIPKRYSKFRDIINEVDAEIAMEDENV